MTLDEAIEDAKAFIKKCDDPEIAFRVAQVAEWLRRARGAEKAARWYTTRMQELEEACDQYADLMHEICDLDAYGKLKAENATLRQELGMREESAQEQTIEYLRSENADWEDKYRTLATENAKLRELARDMYHSAMRCMRETGIWPTDPACLEERMRELGVN